MDADLIIAVLGAGGLSAVLGSVITGLASKKKLGAEATEIITKAATGVVEAMEHQLNRAQQDLKEAEDRHERRMDKMAAAHVQERKEWQKVLQLHVAWDAMAIAKLADMQITMPPVPPVTPSQRFVDDEGYPVGGVD